MTRGSDVITDAGRGRVLECWYGPPLDDYRSLRIALDDGGEVWRLENVVREVRTGRPYR